MDLEADKPAEAGERSIESLLRRSEERFRRVVESAPNAMVMVNAEGRIEMVNAQAELVFGYGREEMLGRSVEMLVPARLRNGHPAMRASFLKDPSPRPMGAGRDLFAVRKDGSEFPVEIGINPIETDEGMMVLSAIVDISDRKQKEARIHAALKEKEILVSEIHHRVKNNLQVVSSLLDLQSARVSDPIAAETLKDSQRRIRSMAAIHQVLYQSHDARQVDFQAFLDDLVPSLVASYLADPERIAIAIGPIDTALPINAAIPCGLILNELISNALKHAFPDGRDGRIAISFIPKDEDRILLTFADDGIGIPDNLDIEQSETLGLQLITLLTDQLGGNLSINRANPTSFSVEFPRQP